MNDLDKYYKILELEPGATLEEVNQAYKDLAFIWHPDRIPKDNIRLQQKAQEKLKEINEARDRLRSFKPEPLTTAKQKPPQSHPQSHPQSPKQNADLSGKDMSRANLSEKDLSGRNLSYANLTGANLKDAFMHRTNLKGANLFKADLFRANLLQADLREANLREANLIGADFSGADLRGADLRGANVGTSDRILVKLVGANLAGTIMPDGTIHT